MINRICRLTWNENGWQTPSGHQWKREWQKRYNADTNKAYENQHGYGHEEWLFNPAFVMNGLQYGFIQGMEDFTGGHIDNLHLFTIDQTTKQRFYLGFLTDVRVIKGTDKDVPKIDKFVKPLFPQMEEELKKVHADVPQLRKFNYRPNVAFQPNQPALLAQPVEIVSKEFAKRFFRFKPFIFNDALALLLRVDKVREKFRFEAGGPGNKVESYEKHITTGKGTTIGKLHNLIEKHLFWHLLTEEKMTERNISCGRTYVAGNIVDVATIEKKTYRFFEIKTSENIRKNIREAIGQLLDYSLWADAPVSQLVIVSPCALAGDSLVYFERLKKTVGITMEYWQYVEGALNSGEFFSKHK